MSNGQIEKFLNNKVIFGREHENANRTCSFIPLINNKDLSVEQLQIEFNGKKFEIQDKGKKPSFIRLSPEKSWPLAEDDILGCE